MLREATVIAGAILVIVWAVFRCWQQMRVDYASEGIFSLTGLAIIGGAAGGVIGQRITGLVYWGIWAGVVGMIAVYCRYKKWNAWEWLDEVAGWVLVMDLVLSLGGKFRVDWIILITGIVLTVFVAKKYRKFRWYKSGKPGLTGLFAIAWLELGEAVVALLNGNKIYWVSLSLNLIMAAVAISLIYARSGLQVEKKIWQKIRNR